MKQLHKKIISWAVITTLVLLTNINAFASSHREAPMISGDPKVDATDLYAFVSPDKTDTVTLIANYIPFEEPDPARNLHTTTTTLAWLKRIWHKWYQFIPLKCFFTAFTMTSASPKWPMRTLFPQKHCRETSHTGSEKEDDRKGEERHN